MAKLIRIPNHKEWEEREDEGLESEGYPMAYLDRLDKMFDALCEKSDAIKRGIVGKVISFPYADGAAHYVVVKDSPLTVAPIPVGDKWQMSGIMIRGLRKSDVERMTAPDDTPRMFAKKKIKRVP